MTTRKVEKILVSQPEPSNGKSPYYELGEKYEVQFSFRPFIKVERVSLKEFRQQRINILDFTGIVMTSRTAVDHFFSLCEEQKITMPETMKYFCLSEAIALYLQKYTIYRKRKIFFGKSGKLDDLIPQITKHNGEKYLYVVSEVQKNDGESVLEKNKVNYTRAVMYRTVSNDFQEGEAFDYDMLIFFSPTGIKSLQKNFPNFEQGDIKIGCFGAQTAKAVADAGLRLDIEAPTANAPSMTAALEQYLKENNK